MPEKGKRFIYMPGKKGRDSDTCRKSEEIQIHAAKRKGRDSYSCRKKTEEIQIHAAKAKRFRYMLKKKKEEGLNFLTKEATGK
jgi:hypothetical protein